MMNLTREQVQSYTKWGDSSIPIAQIAEDLLHAHDEIERLNKKVNFYWHDGGGVLYLWAMYALGLVVGIGIGMMSVYATIGR